MSQSYPELVVPCPACGSQTGFKCRETPLLDTKRTYHEGPHKARKIAYDHWKDSLRTARKALGNKEPYEIH